MEKYLLVFSILILSSISYFKLAKKFRILDKPNERSSHTNITIRGGGILFPIAILSFYFTDDFQYTYFVFGLLILAVISFLDDIYTLSFKIRFFVQLIGVFLLLYQINLPLFPIPIAFLFLLVAMGYINVHNFMDGINGITGLYSLSSLSVIALINFKESIFDQNLLIYTIIAILVFGFYNFRKKALFFAGDIGSITLGFLLVFLIFKSIIELNAPIIMLSVLIYGADGGCTMLYRKFFTTEKWTDPHRHHIYQKLVDYNKWSHLQVSFLYFGLQLIINLLIFYTYHLNYNQQWILMITVIVLSIFMYYLIFQSLKKDKALIN